MSCANFWVGPNDASSAASPRVALVSAPGSSATARLRLVDCAAKDEKKVLKLTISSPSSCSCTFSAEVTLLMLATSFEMSFVATPVSAWLTIALPFSAAGPRW